MAARKRFTVVIDWTDGTYEDSHDFSVYAESAGAAKKAARARFDKTCARVMKNVRFQTAWILTARRLQNC
jgi:hypothetical protein